MPTQTQIKQGLLSRFNSIRDEQGRTPAAIEKIADVLAIELDHLATEQNQSEERIYQKLQQKLQGKQSGRRKPLDKIIQQYPENNIQTSLNPEQHFDLINEDGQEQFWSPLFETQVYPIRIAFRYWDGQIWKQDSLDKTNWLFNTENVFPTKENELWLGIQSPKDGLLPENIHLYLDSPQPLAGHDIKTVLPLIQIQNGDEILTSEVTPIGNSLPAESVSDWREKQWLLHEVERPVAEKYQHSFLHIENFQLIQKSTTPRITEQVTLAGQGEPVLWFKLVFPFALSKEIVSDLKIGFNCFPALNRRLRNREETPYLPITTIPLVANELQNNDTNPEYFLGLQKVFYGSGALLQPAIVPDFGDAVAGEYGLQHGAVVSFNQAEARRQLAYTFQLLDREKAVIQSLLGQQVNNGTIRDQLNEVSSTLDQLRGEIGRVEDLEETWFLCCKPLGERENILVRWWVCGGVQ